MCCICSKDDYRQPYMYVPERDTKSHLTKNVNNNNADVKPAQTYFRNYIRPTFEQNSYTHI